MSQGYNPELSRVSIRDHSLNPNTDQLYQPLRETILNPQNVMRHAPLIPIAARSSFVTKEYHILSPYQLQKIEQQTYIPQDVQLQPTRNINTIQNERFIAVDARQRILGPPITPQELNLIRSQGVKKNQVVYQIREPSRPIIHEQISNQNQNQSPNKDSKTYGALPSSSSYVPPPPPPYQSQQTEDRYVPQQFDTYGKNNWTYKYNLFSIIDQPVNRCRELGIEGCGGCPGNQIVASRNRPQSLTYQ